MCHQPTTAQATTAPATTTAAAAALAAMTTSSFVQRIRQHADLRLLREMKLPPSTATAAAAVVASSSSKPTTTQQFVMTPKGQSVLCMTLSIATHFAGYELARSAILAIFTSEQTGFVTPSALPFAMGCVSPFSIALLWSYTRILERYGPRHALRNNTIVCATILLLSSMVLQYVHSTLAQRNNRHNNHTLSKIFIFALFVIQNSFVQLLHTQHWSFISSIVTPEQGAVWFAPIAGVGSVTSTIAAFFVSSLVERVGLTGMLGLAGWIILGSAFFADMAYGISRRHGFEPSKENNAKERNQEHLAVSNRRTSLVRKAYRLFRREPTLGFLFCEVLVCQCLSSLVNFLFMLKIKETITDDNQRAGWTGNCYAWINAASGILQFCALPLLVKRISPRRIWLLMPSIMLGFTIYQSLQNNPSLYLVAMSFFAMKTIEYSLRGVATEMLYVTLDFESRFVGKEVIGLFANRIGKSGMALTLALLTTKFGKTGALERNLLLSTNVVALLWLACSYNLSRLMPAGDNEEHKKVE